MIDVRRSRSTATALGISIAAAFAACAEGSPTGEQHGVASLEALAEAEADAETEADGCGANLHMETVTQTCSYKAELKGRHAVAVMRAECVGDSQVACTFNFLEDYYYGSGCGWRSTSREQACHESDQPICPFPPPPILVKHETLPLNTGDKLCDPPKPFEDRIAWCYDHMAPSTYNDFVTACLSQTTPDTTQEVTCCVPNGGGGAGGQGATSGVGGGSSQGAGGSADTGGGYGAAGASGGYETNASSSSGFGAGFVEVMSL